MRQLYPNWRQFLFCFIACGSVSVEHGFAQEFKGEIMLGDRVFTKDGTISNQKHLTLKTQVSFTPVDNVYATIEPVLTWRNHTSNNINLDFPRAKLDFDISNISMTVGNDTIFWGVSEGAQILNIVNQMDRRADFKGTIRLGQPMIRAGIPLEDGQLDLYYLPWMPKRRLRHDGERLNGGYFTNGENAVFTKNDKQFYPSFAGRYTLSFGEMDVSGIAFHGLNRAPTFTYGTHGLVPNYTTTTQFGVSLQWTHENLIAKVETLHSTNSPTRLGQFDASTSFVIGGEYAFNSIFNTQADLTFATEYSYNSLGLRALELYQNDLLLAARADFNDSHSTSVRLALTHDMKTETNFIEFRLSRRLTNAFHAEALFYGFDNVGDKDVISGYRSDSHFDFRLTSYF